MPDPFDSPDVLLARVAKHIVDVQSAMSEFLTVARGAPIARADAPGVNVRIIVPFRSDIPLEIPAMIFDVFSGLRAALDHAVYAAAITITKLEEPRGTKFPFGDDVATAKKDFYRKRPPAGLDDLADFIIGLEPYQGGRNEALWRLNKARNGKIHKLLTPVSVTGRGMFIGPDSNFKATGGMVAEPWNSQNKELTVATFERLEGNFRIEPIVDIEFVKTAEYQWGSVHPTLAQLHHLTNVIVEEIKRHVGHPHKIPPQPSIRRRGPPSANWFPPIV